MDHDTLKLLIDYLGCGYIINSSDCVEKYTKGECIEKSWSYYDDLNVYPDKIKSGFSILMTADDFEKFKSIILKYMNNDVQ
jgi:hypothetical protein